MSFRLTGLEPEPFRPLFGLSDQALADCGARRVIADRFPGYPDRIELRDAEPGESLLLLNHVHQPADTPYRASHAIFVVEGARARYDEVDQIPDLLRRRPTLSVRAFDAGHLMAEAALVEGAKLEAGIDRLLDDPAVAYLQIHYAARGCYAARVERA